MINSFKIHYVIKEVVIPLGQYSSGLDSNFVVLFLFGVQDQKRVAKVLIIFLKHFVLFFTGVNSFKIKLFYTVIWFVFPAFVHNYELNIRCFIL